MARWLAMSFVVWSYVWAPAYAESTEERAASIRQRLDAARPAGQALQDSVKRNLNLLRDLTRRAEAAGLTLPPVVLPGAAQLRTRNRVGFGPPHVVSQVRRLVVLEPDQVMSRLESRDVSEGQSQFKPVKDLPATITKLGRRAPESAALKVLVAAGIDAAGVDRAFDLWTRIVDAQLAPP